MRKFVFFAAVTALLGNDSIAKADFQVTLVVGGVSRTIADGGVGDADGSTDGEIAIYDTTVNGYRFRFNLSSAGNDSSNGGTIAFLNQSTGSISGSGATTISIIASANNFAVPVGPLQANSGSTLQFLTGSTFSNQADHSYAAYFDASNTLATTTPTGIVIGSGSGQTTSAPGGSSAYSDESHLVATANYALTLQLTAVLRNNGINKIDLDGSLEIHNNPAPAGLILVLTACPVIGLQGWVRRRRNRHHGDQPT